MSKMYIDGSNFRSENETDKSWIQKDAEAQAFLMRDPLELIQLRHLSDYSTAAQMWTKLHTIYVEKSDQSVQIFFNEL